mgnify:FL=1|tara:strand:- start:149 stop:394 length:246 start_codon:yes stop_codon:yes gene_type:complete
MFTVYSKNGCPFCQKFKQVLELEGLPNIILDLNEDFTYEEFYELFGKGSTFPQVVMDDIPLGGCQESLKYMQDNNICCEVL